MDSSSNRLDSEQRRKAEILRQIAVLQAQLVSSESGISNHTPKPSSESPKRKQHNASLWAPATPSPKKRKLKHISRPESSLTSRNVLHNLNSVGDRKRLGNEKMKSEVLPAKPAPSSVLTKLAASNKQSSDALCPEGLVRTTAFVEDPAMPSLLAHEKLENLEIGPYEHKAPFDDPNFEQLEPNSGIRLVSRILSHDDMQDYLRGRYYLSPSRLYSVIRLRPDKQGYDIPVAGDWVTIAVVAERGPVKFSRAPIGIGREGDGNGLEEGESNGLLGKGKQAKDSKTRKKQKESTPPNGKKYVNIKLVDFGARSGSSATGGKAVIRGDAFLTLLLFESDGFDHITREDGRVEKMFKGGSRGAFEAMSKLKEGDVVALLNPKILKPFQRATDAPHPTTNILALSPESASSIAVIGRARDLGMCTVVKRDGKVCGGWCDKRISDVCEWHVQKAVEKQRAGRAEFSIGTSGMSSTSTRKGKPSYDPARQWGLKPLHAHNQEGSATYVVSGHIVNGPGSDSSSLYVAETMGREGQAKAKRKLAGKDADRALKALLERDKEGMRAVVKAREFVMQENQEQSGGAKEGKVADRKEETGGEKIVAAARGTQLPLSKHSYSAEVIKQLGFDPAVKAGHRRSSDLVIQKKLEALSAVQLTKRDFDLGPRPGRRVRSGVLLPPDVTPTGAAKSEQMSSPTNRTVDLDEL